jgi:cytochrome d ubiquinol oxidase subunit II
MDALLPHIWFFLLGLILLLYVVLDGFDLGVGILSLGYGDEDQRSLILGSIGPVWHANLTWLVVLGGLLFGAFPLAYGLILSALYIPIFLMLVGLILRAVSLEFRVEAQDQKAWSLVCGWGSLLAAAAQGLVLGGLLNGLKITGQNFGGGVWDWLQPFPILVAAGLVCGYGLLGATYLICKTEGEIQGRSYRQARVAAVLVLLAMLVLGFWAFLKLPQLTPGWLGWSLLYLLVFILLIAGLLHSLQQSQELAPFLWSTAVFLVAGGGLAASLYPCIILPGVTIAAAAAPGLTLKIMLVVVGLLLPVMLIYNAYLHRVFRGKSREGDYGYGE